MVGKTRRRLTSELIGELVVIDKKIRIAKQELTDLVASRGQRPAGAQMYTHVDPEPATGSSSYTPSTSASRSSPPYSTHNQSWPMRSGGSPVSLTGNSAT
ncbi:hypothetical protein AB0880_30670 [Micromonospora chersina]|uniref:hypothetical protein n=1 Tax=Micromonospora chersina TaxID=47854 RepID=UPI003451509D